MLPRFTIPSALDRSTFQSIRRCAAIQFCKWDPQVEDTSTLAPFPLVIPAECWTELSDLSITLADELFAAESELLHRPDLHHHLGISGRIRRCLRSGSPPLTSPRLVRFDFHWTTDGWRISEVNSDVPGGFTESSSFPRLIASHYPGFHPIGDPAASWASALIACAAEKPIALLSAPGFMEDHQITNYLAMRLREQGAFAQVITGRQLTWRDNRACINDLELGLLFRFYQAEWLPSLGRRSGWQNFFNSKTPISNPAHSILTESKRFPLIWENLKTAMPTWKKLLPQTLPPSDINFKKHDGWLLKSAFCNNGDSVSIPGSPHWKKSHRSAFWFPSHWLAQRRFETLPIATPAGPMYPCLGVYVLEGKPIGIYGRISAKPVIDFTAIDIAVLMEAAQ